MANTDPFDGTAAQIPNQSFPSQIIWTPAQWREAWVTKVDATNGILTNPTINGGTLTGFAAINNTPIGTTTPNAGAFTTLSTTGLAALTGGGSFGGNWGGTLNLTGSGTALAVANNASVAGQLALNAAGTRYFTYNATDGALEYYAGTSQLLKIADSGDLYFNAGDADLHLGGTGQAAAWFANTLYAGQGSTWTATSGTQTPGEFAFYVNGNLAGSSPNQVWDFCQIVVDSDTLQTVGNSGGVNWLEVVGNVGAGFTGKRAAFSSTININGTNGSVPDDSSRQWVAEQLTAAISANQGGTSPHSGTSAGFIYSGGDQMWAYSGATNLSGVIGREIDVAIYTGASAAERIGLQIFGFGEVQGSDSDVALRLGTNGTAPWLSEIGLTSSPDPTNGVILSYLPPTSQNPAPAVAPIGAKDGIDLTGINFAEAAFRSPGNFAVDGAGNLSVGAVKVSTTGATASIDAPGGVLATAATNGTGSGYQAGEQVFDRATGTILQIGTVNGSGTPTSISILRKGAYTGTSPGTPLTMLGGNGSGLTVAVTWTAATTLELQPGGGAVRAGSGAWTANGTTSVSLTAVAPAGAHATVQEWLTITDSAGTVRYIPCF